MNSRTVDDALIHAEQQREYALRESPPLITDFILLADEVKRLRGEQAKYTPEIEAKIKANVTPHKHEFRGPAGRQWKCVTCGEPLSGPMEYDNQ